MIGRLHRHALNALRRSTGLCDIELAGKINQQMPYHCVAKVERALNDAGRPVKGSRIALLGVSYKPGVGDIRESRPLALPPGCYAPASPLLRRYLAGIGLFE